MEGAMMRHILVLLMVLLSPSLWATQREVGSGQTYATIQSCLNAAVAGDTCNVHAGTYTEQLTIPNGTAGNVVTLRANPGDTVTVQSSSTPVINVASRSYFTIDGLNVTYTGSANPAAVIGNNDSASHHFTISNNHLTMNGGGCSDRGALNLTYAHDFTVAGNTIYVNSPSPCDGGDYLNVYNVEFTGNTIYGNANTNGKLEDGLVFGGYNINIANNTLHDGWSYDTHPDGIVIQGWWPNGAGTTHDVKVVGNTVYNFSQSIYIDAISTVITSTTIANNVLYASGYSYGGNSNTNGIILTGENVVNGNGYFALGVLIYNNTIDTRWNPIRVLQTPNSGNAIDIQNNILVTPPYGGMNIGNSSGVALDYNYYSGGDSQPIYWVSTGYSRSSFAGAGLGETHGKNGAANLNADYTEKATSLTVGQGADLSTYFTTDRAGNTRTVPWDMGAYEYQTGAPSIGLSPATLPLGSIPVGQSSSGAVIIFTNTGTASLTVGTISVTGNFSQTNTCGATLAPNANCSITVTSTPASTGAYSGTLTVSSPNATNSPQTVSLSGNGTHVTRWGALAGPGSFTVGLTQISFASPFDTNIDQTPTPAIFEKPLGVGDKFTDVTGNIVIRVSDRSMAGGTTLGTGASFRTDSDSNDNVWSSDDRAFSIYRTGGGMYVVAWDPATNTPTPKGLATCGNGCDGPAWRHDPGHPLTYRYNPSSSSLLNEAVINPLHSAWINAAGTGSSNIYAAETTSTLLNVATDCPGLAYNKYADFTLVDLSIADRADRFTTFGGRMSADNGFHFFIYDQQRGCHWVDSRTMTDGGAWGHSGLLTYAGTVLLPAPAAPTLTATTGGSLTQGHQYAVCLEYVKSIVGPTTCSAISLVTVNAPNNAIQVTAPTATPANTATGPGGFNFFACDRSAPDSTRGDGVKVAGANCVPTQQTNGTNASGALAQPVITNLACTSGTCTTGTNTYCVKIYANNAGGSSPYSAPVCVSVAGGLGTGLTATFNQVANATSYTATLDYDYVGPVRNNAGSCSGGVCSIAINTSPNQMSYQMVYAQSTPIAITPTITSLSTTGQVPDLVNGSGYNFHDGKGTADGKWIWMGPSVSLNCTQHAIGPIYYDLETGVAVPAGQDNASFPELNIPNQFCGHRVIGMNQIFCNDGNAGKQTTWTLNDDSATLEASKTVLSEASLWTPFLDDIHVSGQMQASNGANPWYVGSDSGTGHTVGTSYLAGYLWAIENKAGGKIWKLCQNWTSGEQGFNSRVGGHISPSGKFVLFSSDMERNGTTATGALGCVDGTSTCADQPSGANVGTGPRTDAFVCAVK